MKTLIICLLLSLTCLGDDFILGNLSLNNGGFILYQQRGFSTVTNTLSETSMLGPPVRGSTTLPAGFWTEGRTIIITLEGPSWTTATPLVQSLKVKLGSTVILQHSSLLPAASLVGDTWGATISLQCLTNTASGALVVNGTYRQVNAVAGVLYNTVTLTNGTGMVFMDMTPQMVLDVTMTPGSTGNAWMSRVAHVVLYP